MNNIYFYLLLGVFFYFVINKIIDNYLSTQENFDPSLVPVSSIVTLAKVAQKLVNGNGTLTNPGSLQIGASTATPGNLTVTGNSRMNGSTTTNGALMVNGNIFIGNKAMLYSASDPSVNDKWVRLLQPDGSANYASDGDGNGGFAAKNLHSDRDLHAQRNLKVVNNTNTASLDVTGNSQINGNLKVINNINTKSLDVTGNLITNGSVVFGGNTATGFKWTNESDNGWACLRAGNNDPNADGNRLCYHKDHGLTHFWPNGRLEINGRMEAHGGLFAGGGKSICIDATCINENELKHLKSLLNGSLYFQLQAGQTGLLNTKNQPGGAQPGDVDTSVYFHMVRLNNNNYNSGITEHRSSIIPGTVL